MRIRKNYGQLLLLMWYNENWKKVMNIYVVIVCVMMIQEFIIFKLYLVCTRAIKLTCRWHGSHFCMRKYKKNSFM